MIKQTSLILCLLPAIFCFSCKSYTPKPKTYIHIELPEKTYVLFDSVAYPFTFKMPEYAVFDPIKDISWADLNFPSLGASINLTYIPNPNLDSCISNSLFFVERNLGKSNGMDEIKIRDTLRRIYGYVYDLKGSDVATTCQFYFTDSSKHFVRGALYLNCVPNNDSLAPVIQFLRTDIDSLLSSWQWR